jgi:hypothetical protein
LIAAIYPSVNLQPLIKIPKIDTQHPAPKNEISKWLVVSRMEKNYNTIYTDILQQSGIWG